jgi:hypothetical protein
MSDWIFKQGLPAENACQAFSKLLNAFLTIVVCPDTDVCMAPQRYRSAARHSALRLAVPLGDTGVLLPAESENIKLATDCTSPQAPPAAQHTHQRPQGNHPDSTVAAAPPPAVQLAGWQAVNTRQQPRVAPIQQLPVVQPHTASQLEPCTAASGSQQQSKGTWQRVQLLARKLLHHILVSNSTSSSGVSGKLATKTAAVPRHLQQQLACHPFGSLQHLHPVRRLQQNHQHLSAL